MMGTKGIGLIVLLLSWSMAGVDGQVLERPDTLLFSGVVMDADSSRPLSDVVCRYGGLRGTLSDEDGCFRIRTVRGDSVLFTYVGYRPCVVVVPDSLRDGEYIIGIFMSRDTLLLSEAVVVRRWGAVRRQNLVNARNNMAGILRQAYSSTPEMDAGMNQRMIINEYARSVEMKGHVDVRLGVGTESLEAYNRLRWSKRVGEKREWLDYGEIDLLKKLYYTEKREKTE